jgi:hypothetical protein
MAKQHVWATNIKAPQGHSESFKLFEASLGDSNKMYYVEKLFKPAPGYTL